MDFLIDFFRFFKVNFNRFFKVVFKIDLSISILKFSSLDINFCNFEIIFLSFEMNFSIFVNRFFDVEIGFSEFFILKSICRFSKFSFFCTLIMIFRFEIFSDFFNQKKKCKSTAVLTRQSNLWNIAIRTVGM